MVDYEYPSRVSTEAVNYTAQVSSTINDVGSLRYALQ